MSGVTKPNPSFNDVTLLKLARDVAMDMRPIEDILQVHDVSTGDWQKISELPSFQSYLRQSIQEWNSATNTAERVKLKSMAFVEEALPEFYARAHDPKEPLNSKVEVLKTVARFAGVGGSHGDGTLAGERLTVTINLGADHQLKIEKNFDQSYDDQIIEGDAL